MRLTVLGSSASYADAGRACAGHLLEEGATAVLMDCGNGTLANLACIVDPTELDAVIITHEHVDHFADLYALQAALRYAPAGPAAPLSLHVPAGLFERIGSVLNERGRAELADAFVVSELAAGAPFAVGGLTITPSEVDHVFPTFGLRITNGSCTIAYTSDTAPGARALSLAEGSDVLLSEATLPARYAGRAPHLTAAQAGELASEAGVHTLVLTHLWPTVDRTAAAREAGEAFSGRIIVAEEMTTINCEENR